MAACDRRDWFRYGRRYEAYLRCWNEWAGASAAPASPSYQGSMIIITTTAAAAVKPRILYKREWEIDRQIIPL